MKKNTLEKISSFLIMFMYMAMGGVGGFVAIVYMGTEIFGDDMSFLNLMTCYIIAIVALLIGLYIHTIIHELGHLVCGLISGYKFSSFRIGNIIFLNDDGKIQIKKYSLPGTGGQCIMIPQQEDYSKIPFVLYNLGGVLANGIVSLITVFLIILCPMSDSVLTLLICFVAAGVVTALTNGIPMKTANVDNDGLNIVTLKKNPSAIKDYVNMFYVHYEMTKGKKLSEMDEKYFEVSEEGNKNNSITTATYLNKFFRYMEQEEYEKANELADYILDNFTNIVGIHKYSVMLERMYSELITDGDKMLIEDIYYNEEIQKFLKLSKSMLSVARVQYAYALLARNNEDEAKMYWDKFYKIKKTYPYKSDADTEEKLLLLAKQQFDNR